VNAAKALALPAAMLVLAEIGGRAAAPSDSIAPPSQIVVAFVQALADGSLVAATRDTLLSALVGSTRDQVSAL